MVHNGEKSSLSKNIAKAHYLPKLKQVFELDMHSWMIKQNFRLETNLCNASIHIVCKMGPISIQTTIKPDKVNDKIMNYGRYTILFIWNIKSPFTNWGLGLPELIELLPNGIDCFAVLEGTDSSTQNNIIISCLQKVPD